MIKRISAPMMSAVMPSSEAAPAAVAMASPITSMPLHLENPRVVNTRPTRQQIQKTPQASSTAAWWSRVVTVQIGPRHAVAPVTMVASQTAQKSSTGSKAHSARRSRRGTGTRSRLHGCTPSTKPEKTSSCERDRSAHSLTVEDTGCPRRLRTLSTFLPTFNGVG